MKWKMGSSQKRLKRYSWFTLCGSENIIIKDSIKDKTSFYLNFIYAKPWSRLVLLCATILFIDCAHTSDVICPVECECTLGYPIMDSTLIASCTQGDMVDIPVGMIDRRTEIMIVSAPKTRPNHLTIGPIFTQPEPFTNLQEIHIAHSNVPSIGQYSFWGLKYLRLLNLTYNNITGVVADNFRGLINLTELYLDHNSIDMMPSETFGHLTALKTLSLSNNQITVLMPRIFRMLARLRYLDLSHNPLEDLPPEVFKDIQHLRVFKCRNCKIRRINTQIYYLTPLLEELDLGDNLFKYLEYDEFISLRYLKKLKMDGNQLPVIVDFTFTKQLELESLSFARNRLALLAPASMTNLTSLIHLDISDNKINKYFPNTLAPVSKTLRTINLSGNDFSLHEIGIILKSLPDIHVIGLGNMGIKHFPPYFFAGNKYIVGLDLSDNQFTHFPLETLSKMKFLQRLDLSGNKMHTLDEAALDRLEVIAYIDISRNPWRCDQCSVGTMLMYMANTVLNDSIRGLKCQTPLKWRGKFFGILKTKRLDACPKPMSSETQLTVIAGLMLLVISVFAAIATALCCSKRRAARYYTREAKPDSDSEIPDELLENSELGSVATIHAPLQASPSSS